MDSLELDNSQLEDLDSLELDNSQLEDLDSLELDNSQLEDLDSTFVDDLEINFELLQLTATTKKEIEREFGSHFNKILYAHANHYIQLCIEYGGDNIYNYTMEMIRVLKMSCKVLVPCDSFLTCLLCKTKFENKIYCVYEHLRDLKHVNNFYTTEIYGRTSLHILTEYMKRTIDCNTTHCYACDSNISILEEDIIAHIGSEKHNNETTEWKIKADRMFQSLMSIISNAWYNAHFFICLVCDARFDIELDFIVHLQSRRHILKIAGKNLKYDVCPVCVTCWLDFQDVYNEHCENSMHKYCLANKQFAVPELSLITRELLNDPDELIDIIVEESNESNSPKEQDKENVLLDSIQKIIGCEYPNAKAYIFGSRLSLIGFPSSDVDIFLDCENVYQKGSRTETNEYFEKFRTLVENDENHWVIDEILLACRVPIIKLRHLDTTLKCDISFLNGLGVEKSKLVRKYNIASFTCRKMILYLKKWLNSCQLSGSVGINNYALSWLVIFYLQIQGILPNVYEIIQTREESVIFNGWNCTFADVIPAFHTTKSFKELLKGFFEYYNSFDYRSSVVCPLLGQTLLKKSFADIGSLPEELDNYKHYLCNRTVEFFRLDSPMCIQDPIDLSHNITKAVSKLQLKKFFSYCRQSALILSNN